MFAEWLVHGKPSVLGIISGAVAGLVAITPASGFVDPSRRAVHRHRRRRRLLLRGDDRLKHALGYDDSLDAFGVHGVGGIVGAMLTGVFAGRRSAASGKSGLIDGNSDQVLIQFEGVARYHRLVRRRHLHHPHRRATSWWASG